MRRQERSDTDLVVAARADDPTAFGQLFDRWFDRAWNVARTIVRDDDLAADVAQDALVHAWQQLEQLRDPDAFGGWLLRSTRNRALNRLARERRSTASGNEVVSGLRDRGQTDPTAAERLPEPDAVNEIRDRQELLWAAAAALGEGDASLLDLHLRHGLTPAEIAEELGVAANAAHQQLFRLRDRLGDAIGSYLLWRNGRPLCDGLAAAVSGDKAFSRSVAKAVRKHQASCERCSEEREALVDPHKLFAAVPLVVAPAGLKAQAAAALESAGVPVGSSATGGESASVDGNPTEGGPTSGNNGSEASADGGSTGGDAAPDGGSTGGDAAPDGVTGNDGGSDGLAGDGSGGGVTTPSSTPQAVAPITGPIIVSHPSHHRHLATTAGRVSRRELLVGAGAGLLTLAILFGLAALFLGGDDDLGLLTGLESRESDPEVASGQGGNGDEGDPAGPASFSRDAAPTDDSTTTSPTSRSTSRTTRTTRTSTSLTTSTTDATTSTTAESTTSSSISTTATTRDTTTSDTTATTQDTTTSDTTATTQDTTTSDTTATTRPSPPVISLSVARASSNGCPDSLPYVATWSTRNATSADLTWPSGSAAVATSGSREFCVLPGQAASVTLKATGPGGTTTDSASG